MHTGVNAWIVTNWKPEALLCQLSSYSLLKIPRWDMRTLSPRLERGWVTCSPAERTTEPKLSPPAIESWGWLYDRSYCMCLFQQFDVFIWLHNLHFSLANFLCRNLYIFNLGNLGPIWNKEKLEEFCRIEIPWKNFLWAPTSLPVWVPLEQSVPNEPFAQACEEYFH